MTELTSSNEFESKIRHLQKVQKRKLIAKIISACLTFVLIIVYFILPVSRVTNSKINGKINYNDEQILEIAGLNKTDSLYLISKSEIEENLKSSPLIDANSVKVKLSPFGLKIELEEIAPVLKYQSDVYMSNGNKLDSSLLQSKDPLVGDYLYIHTQELVTLFSKPFDEKFSLSRVSHLSKLVLSLTEEERSKIVGISYDSNNYYFSFYYRVEDSDTLLKIVFDSAKNLDTLIEIIRQDKVDKYISYLFNSKTKDKFISFNETLNDEVRTIKSIKIVMQTIGEKVYYHVKYNNPSSDNEEIEKEENENV